MQIKLAVGAGALCLLLGTIAPAYAQQHQAGPEKKTEQAKPQRSEQAKPQRSQPPAQRPARPASKPQPAYGGSYHGGVQRNGPVHGGVHHSGVPQSQAQLHSGFQQSRAHAWETEHRTWQQRGGYNGYRVPDDRFHMYFGREHFFRIGGLPLRFVGGYPRFLYDGYWVMLVDPWPDAWPANWYDTDDVYVEYVNDGYYLFDRMHPGIAIAVTLSL
jgi:hypothetical protein